MKYKVDFWRPNKDGKGAAALFNYNDEKQQFFLSMMPQSGTGEKSFDSGASINFKLGPSDIGEILAVLSGRKEGLGRFDASKQNDKSDGWSGLYHQAGDNNYSTMGLTANDNGYRLRLYRSNAGNSQNLSMNLSSGEAAYLLEFIRSNIKDMTRDNYSPSGESPRSEPAPQKTTATSKPSAVKNAKQAVAAAGADAPF